MGVEAKIIVMLCCDVPAENTDVDEYYDDLDNHSSWKRDKITYIHDGMSGEYFYVGEVLGYCDDAYESFSFVLDDNQYANKQLVMDFCKEKFNLEQEAKIRVFNYVY